LFEVARAQGRVKQLSIRKLSLPSPQHLSTLKGKINSQKSAYNKGLSIAVLSQYVTVL
jgi:hypothetical protein